MEGGAPYVGLHDAQAECVCLAIEWEGIYVPAIEYEGNGQSTVGCGDEVPVQVKCVPDQDAKEVTVSKKTKEIKKVWTRLRNGLYGRRRQKAKVVPKDDEQIPGAEQDPPSVSAEFKWVPANMNILNILETKLEQEPGGYSRKRKLHLDLGRGIDKGLVESESTGLGLEPGTKKLKNSIFFCG